MKFKPIFIIVPVLLLAGVVFYLVTLKMSNDADRRLQQEQERSAQINKQAADHQKMVDDYEKFKQKVDKDRESK